MKINSTYTIFPFEDKPLSQILVYNYKIKGLNIHSHLIHGEPIPKDKDAVGQWRLKKIKT